MLYNEHHSMQNTDTKNVTRDLQWSDNGKTIRCVANHIALDKPLETTTTLDVYCELPISRFLASHIVSSTVSRKFHFTSFSFQFYTQFYPLFVLFLISKFIKLYLYNANSHTLVSKICIYLITAR